eukprot:CAMPEP_0204589570 /NCGR_PEP_ID=MMETSP0661-20131031/49278_1 /ASSEMBLY_ACC=CAM_ASM_000606 /TAXON_ID=109239 /ORGANISM="Alexandrium margalefi, Strain AMGDE01CS-322" /LENGTH=69 /DNA_ID=CAMNT_0051599499 /DNA_START=128 /DNA_END=334 /DNA_ORIENTATION=+
MEVRDRLQLHGWDPPPHDHQPCAWGVHDRHPRLELGLELRTHAVDKLVTPPQPQRMPRAGTCHALPHLR